MHLVHDGPNEAFRLRGPSFSSDEEVCVLAFFSLLESEKALKKQIARLKAARRAEQLRVSFLLILHRTALSRDGQSVTTQETSPRDR